MTRTRLSLFYLAGYLTFAGLALLLVPSFALKLLLSNGDYGEVFPRLAGMLLLGLAILVTQIIRHRIEVLYPTTLVVRLFFLVVFAYLFLSSSDPFFLVVFGIVLLGVVLTGYSYLTEHRAADA
jgi:thiol:disulfide interchange protein